MLFAFCRQCHLDQTEQFLLNENYDAQHLQENTRIQQSVRHVMPQKKWSINPSRPLPLLYLLGKAKSLLKCCILWRPIAAVVEPQLQRFYLRTAARAFSLLPEILTEETKASFLVLNVPGLQPWIHSLPDSGCEVVGECDCSGQFNNMKSTTMTARCRICLNRRQLAQRHG